MKFWIETSRLILRDFNEDDWPHYSGHFKEPESQLGILKYQSGDDYLKNTFESCLRLTKYQYRRGYHLMIVEKESQIPIGNCSLVPAITHARNTQVGWHFGYEYRGKGYATEAANRLLELGFKKQLVSTIHADTFLENIASIRVMEKLGMKRKHSGIFMRWIRGYRYGERRAIVKYQITKQMWDTNRMPSIHYQ